MSVASAADSPPAGAAVEREVYAKRKGSNLATLLRASLKREHDEVPKTSFFPLRSPSWGFGKSSRRPPLAQMPDAHGVEALPPRAVPPWSGRPDTPADPAAMPPAALRIDTGVAGAMPALSDPFFDGDGSMQAGFAVQRPSISSVEVSPTTQRAPARPLLPALHAPFSERAYLTHSDLSKIMPSGVEAIRLSGLVPEHVHAIQRVARELDTVIAFRAVNPDSAYWIAQGKTPVKDLLMKQKTEKGGLLGGLLVSSGGRRETNITALDAEIFGGHLTRLLEHDKLEIRPNTPEEDVDPNFYTLTVHDVEKDSLYKLRLDQVENKFTVLKQHGKEFRPVSFKGRGGALITADYDAFDYYPRIKEKNFAGHKDIGNAAAKPAMLPGGGNFRRAVRKVMEQQHPQRKLASFVSKVMEEVLELPEVKAQKGVLGRLTKIDNFIRERINSEVRQSCNYPHDVVMHGKEKRNTQYPELCDRVLFVFPDHRPPLLTNSWEKTQAVDYLLQQEDFVSTVNRVYNQQAGSKPLFEDQNEVDETDQPAYKRGSGKQISWNSRAAAANLHAQFAELEGQEVQRSLAARMPRLSSIDLDAVASASAAGSRRVSNMTSFSSAAGRARFSSISSAPPWLMDFIERAMADHPETAREAEESYDETSLVYGEPGAQAVLYEEPAGDAAEEALAMAARPVVRKRPPRRPADPAIANAAGRRMVSISESLGSND